MTRCASDWNFCVAVNEKTRDFYSRNGPRNYWTSREGEGKREKRLGFAIFPRNIFTRKNRNLTRGNQFIDDIYFTPETRVMISATCILIVLFVVARVCDETCSREKGVVMIKRVNKCTDCDRAIGYSAVVAMLTQMFGRRGEHAS